MKGKGWEGRTASRFGRRRHQILHTGKVGGHGADEHIDTLSPEPCLHAPPDAGHDGAIEHGP